MKKNSAFEIVLSALIFVFVMVWGNVPALCAIFPIVGGAIGGGISGGGFAISLVLMRRADSLPKKLLYWLIVFVATVLICFIIAKIVIAALS